MAMHTGDGTHAHVHSHNVNGREMEHSHPHQHRLDGTHIASDGDHLHVPGDERDLVPVQRNGRGRAVIRKSAAAAGGHSAEKIAAAYRAMGDDVLVALSHPGADDPPVMLSAADVRDAADTFGVDPAELALAPSHETDLETERVGLSAPSVIDGSQTEILSPGELEEAEAQLAASTDGSEFTLSADDPLAADAVQGEIFRYSQQHQRDQLKVMGYRVPRRGF
jgi:hypothetical protein